MCYLKPLKVKKLKGRIAFLENGLKAFYDKNIAKIKQGDTVIVYGNLIIQKNNEGPRS